MKIKVNHYVDTIIYSIDKIIKNLKSELKDKIDSLNLGITGEQFIVLDTISSYSGIYQQKLSEIIMKDKSNTTRILKILENKGLIERKIGRENNRLVYFLSVSDTGREIVNCAMPKIKDFIVEIFKTITDDEISLLHDMSKKFEKDLFKVIEK